MTEKNSHKSNENFEEQQNVEEVQPEQLDSKLIFDQDLKLTEKEIVYHFKVFKKLNKKKLHSIELEMHKYDDIFFLMKSKVDLKKFQTIEKKYSLTIEFEEFLNAILLMFSNSINNNPSTKLNFKNTEKGGILSFYDVLELRAVEIFALEFAHVSKAHQMIYAQQKFNEIKDLLDKKNRELDIFLQEVHKKNYTMFDHIEQKVSIYSVGGSTNPGDSYQSVSIPSSPHKTPMSPKSPKSPKSPR